MPRNHEISTAEGIAPRTNAENKKIGQVALFYRFGPDGKIELS